MKEETAIRILKDLYDYGDLPQACLQALEKATTALKYQKTAKVAIERSAMAVENLQDTVAKYEAALDEAARQFAQAEEEINPNLGNGSEELAEELKRTWKEKVGL